MLKVWILIADVVGKYFDEISQDSGRYCFGVQETLKALEMGAVEILIVWENMEVIRYVLKNNTTTGEFSAILNGSVKHTVHCKQCCDGLAHPEVCQLLFSIQFGFFADPFSIKN